MIWFHQEKRLQLGIFVDTMPFLRAMSEKKNKPIPVYFDTKTLESLFVECPFIEILQKKPKSESLPLRPRWRKKGESDLEAWMRKYCPEYGKNIPLYYLDDIPSPIDVPSKSVAIFHGCLSEHLINDKSLPLEVMSAMISKPLESGMNVIVLGNTDDYNRFWKKIEIPKEANNLLGASLRDSVGALSQCDCSISNDTGFCHVGGALSIPGLVMWTGTDFHKNRSMFEGISHCICKNPQKRVKRFLNAIDEFISRRVQA